MSELVGVVQKHMNYQEVASETHEFPLDGEGPLGSKIIAYVLTETQDGFGTLSSLDPLVLPAAGLSGACLTHHPHVKQWPLAHCTFSGWDSSQGAR